MGAAVEATAELATAELATAELAIAEGASPEEVAEAEAAAREAIGDVLLLAKHWKELPKRLSKRKADLILRILLADLVFSVFGTVEIPKKRVRGSKGWSKTLLRLRTREEPVPMKSRKLKRRSVKKFLRCLRECAFSGRSIKNSGRCG